jgi:hypothetical protein
VKKLRFPPGLALRLIARTTYVGNVSLWSLNWTFQSKI